MSSQYDPRAIELLKQKKWIQKIDEFDDYVPTWGFNEIYKAMAYTLPGDEENEEFRTAVIHDSIEATGGASKQDRDLMTECLLNLISV